MKLRDVLGRCLCGLLLPLLLLVAARAADAPAPADMVFANRSIFVFRSALIGYSPQDRADAASKRLERALEKGGPQQPTIRAIGEGTQVLLDDSLLFLVAPADINALAGDTTRSLALESAEALSKGLQARREQASWRYLALATAACLAATLVYILVLRLLGATRRWATRRFGAALGQHIEKVSFRNVRLLDAAHYRLFVRNVFALLVWTLRILATYLWVAFVLGRIPYTRSWGEQLQHFLVARLLEILENTALAIPGLLVAALIMALARFVSVNVKSVFKRVESGELTVGWLDQDTAAPTRRLVNIVVWLFALAMAYPYLPGAHTAAFQGVTVLAGLMVSIGASSIVGQGASGLILMYTRSLRKGEYVRVGSTEGTVVAMGMFETRLRTGLGAEVSMPNAWVLSNTIQNFSRSAPGTGFMVDTTMTVGYDTSWRQVHALLEGAARATEGIADTPAPFIAQSALSDFYIEYKLVAHATTDNPRRRIEVLSRLHQNIVDAFNEHGLEMTSPHFMQEPATSHVVPRSAWFTAPAVDPASEKR